MLGGTSTPNVVVIKDDLTDGQLKALMEKSHALVALAAVRVFDSRC